MGGGANHFWPQAPAADDPMIESFAVMSAHEMLEPLVAIEAYATFALERLTETAEGDGPRTELESITRIAQRTRELLEVFLRELRPDPAPLEVRRVDLGVIVAESLEVLTAAVQARGMHVRVGALPTIDVDAALFRSLMTNMLANAVKYGPPHGGTISVLAEQRPEEWLIRIGGAGAPIDGGEADAIFEPFRRGRAARVRGHGMGLAVCRRIAERHGGRIGVISGPGTANTFVVALPRSEAG